MPVRVARGLAKQIVEQAGGFTICSVRGPRRPCPGRRLAARATALTLGVGGPGASDDDLVQALEELAALAAAIAPDVAYAALDMEPTFAGLLGEGDAGPGPVHYQILGPGHRERLVVMPQEAVPLDGDRIGLRVGDWRSWLRTGAERATGEGAAADVVRRALGSDPA